MAIQLDTTGFIGLTLDGKIAADFMDETAWTFTSLSPFTQGYIEALATDNFTRVAAMPSDNDETGHCRHCGRDNRGEEDGPCSDECPRQDIRFSDLAPETLARIIADCEAGEAICGSDGYQATGLEFWKVRQAGLLAEFPPLTVQLGGDGKVRFAGTAQ